MARQLEQSVIYTDDLRDEWHAYPGVDTWGWSDRDFRDFVRCFNRKAKATGDGIRLRSIEVEEG